MNLDQYRGLKAQEQEEKASQTDQTQSTLEQPETKPVEDKVVVEKPTETKEEEPKQEESKLPDEIEIEGVGKVSIDELKNGYLRTSDYTKKAQEVSKIRKESEEALRIVEQLKSNPQAFQQVTGQQYDPAVAKIQELEEKIYDMMLEKEIETLQSKYSDFEVRTVLKTAKEKGITNLEDAYLLTKNSQPAPSVNIDDLKKQIREELLKEIQSEKDSTQSIITNNDNSTSVIKDNTPQLSEQERKVAQMMKMSDVEYAKWRDVNKKK